MEAHWERTDGHLSLDLDGARALLAPLGVEPLALELVAEGKANTNYRVDTPKGPVRLRLHHGSDEAVELEAALAMRLRGLLPVPRLLGRGARFLVFEWLPGLSLERALGEGRDLPYLEIARGLARARRALDGVRFPSAGLLGPDLRVASPWPSAVDGLLGWLLRRALPEADLDVSLRDRVARVADDARPRLEAIAGPPALSHGDFKASNLLVDGSGLVAVLDWEFAHAGTWLLDAGQLLRHWRSLPTGFAEAFLEELGAPEDAATLARALDLMNLVEFLTKSEGRPRLRGDATRLVREACDAYEARFLLA